MGFGMNNIDRKIYIIQGISLSDNMVMRTFEINKISFSVEKKRQKEVLKQLKELYGDRLKIAKKGNEISVSGDLHNFKLRRKILWILSGGKHGKDV